jgi:CspA family cold shock protein
MVEKKWFNGIVKFFRKDKMYGFIAPDDGGKDVFVHAKCLAEAPYLEENDVVSFKIGKDPKGRREAKNVLLVKSKEAK